MARVIVNGSLRTDLLLTAHCVLLTALGMRTGISHLHL